MRFSVTLRLALGALWDRKARTTLTLVGVMIGSATLLLLVSLGQGVQEYVERNLEKQGSLNTIAIIPNLLSIAKGGERPITDEDVRKMEAMEHVKSVLPGKVVAPLSIKSALINDSSLAVAIPDARAKKHAEIDIGKMLAEGSSVPVLLQVEKGKRKQLLGSDIELLLDQAYGATTDKRVRATVVGFIDAEDVGSPDVKIFMPLTSGRRIASLLNEENNESLNGYDRVTIRVDSIQNIINVSRRIEGLGYRTYSVLEEKQNIGIIFKVIKFVLAALGAITLLVSALGIANTLTMTVLERTREIGILRSIGASRKQIRRLFLTEALAIGLVGGLLGVLVTYMVGGLLNLVAVQFVIRELRGQGVSFFALMPLAVLFGLLFTSTLSIVSGYFPARRAANLNPVDALKHQ